MNEPIQITIAHDATKSANVYSAVNTATTSYLPTEMQMFTPYPNHTTELAASLYASCSITDCTEQANPLNAIEATLDVLGSPVVRVCFCDNHYHLFGNTTAEHEKPDIAVKE